MWGAQQQALTSNWSFGGPSVAAHSKVQSGSPSGTEELKYFPTFLNNHCLCTSELLRGGRTVAEGTEPKCTCYSLLSTCGCWPVGKASPDNPSSSNSQRKRPEII